MKRAMTLIILFFLLSFLLISCSKNEPVEYLTEESDAEAPENKEYDLSTTEYIKEKYDGYDFGGADVSIISISPGSMYYGYISGDANEIWYEEDSAEVQQHSVFTRNLLTEDLINVKIKPTWGGDVYDLYDRARTIAMSGIDDFDLMITAHFRGLLSGTMGYFRNVYGIDSLDMGGYWWDQDFIDCYTFEYDKLFSLTGDALIFDDMAFKVVYFNPVMIENFGLDDPTVLVEEGKWTADVMKEMAGAVTSDTDGDGVMTAEDTWGILDDNSVITIRMFDGFGIRIADKDENDIPYLAAENSDFINAVQYIFDNFVMSGYVYSNHDEEEVLDIFTSDRGLFAEWNISSLFSLRNMESDFGLLPLPKYNENQKEYSSVLAPGVMNTFSIPVTVSDTEKVGIFLNVLGGFSTDTVDRTLNEVLLGPKLLRNERTVEMLEYALDSKFYDWAKDIKWAFPIYQSMTDQQDSKTFYFASSIKRISRQSQAMLNQLLNGYSFY